MAEPDPVDEMEKLAKQGVKFLSAPVSGNAKVIKAGKLTVSSRAYCARRRASANSPTCPIRAEY